MQSLLQTPCGWIWTYLDPILRGTPPKQGSRGHSITLYNRTTCTTFCPHIGRHYTVGASTQYCMTTPHLECVHLGGVLGNMVYCTTYVVSMEYLYEDITNALDV